MNDLTMTSPSDYKFGELIHESANSMVYRGLKGTDGQTLILKILKDAYPSPDKIAEFKNEYDIVRSLDLRGVVKAYDLEKNQQRWLMVLEDFGGLSLLQLDLAGKLTISNFLALAVRITRIVGQIHEQKIIHKDLNPSNILVYPFDPEIDDLYEQPHWPVKITDFGLSAIFSRESPTFHKPNVLEGTLAYISPEQTGRMNRELDYRTDLYSLGVTFYQLLTGKLPFQSDDALELVHCHIAKPPPPPDQVRPDLPPALSEIILKLLAKNAEDRYQSAVGLAADLETCLSQWRSAGRVDSFPLAEQDVLDQLQIPQKLYGRQQETDTILNILDTIRPGSNQLVLVTGPDGIGKSAWAENLYGEVIRRQGRYVSGAFSPDGDNIPYEAFVLAINSLAEQLLIENETQVAIWKEKITEALGVDKELVPAVHSRIRSRGGCLTPGIRHFGPGRAGSFVFSLAQAGLPVFTGRPAVGHVSGQYPLCGSRFAGPDRILAYLTRRKWQHSINRGVSG